MNLTKPQAEKFQRLRITFLYDIVRPFNGYSASGFLEPVREFEREHLENCRVLPKREDVMDFLPKGGLLPKLVPKKQIRTQAL